MIAAAEGRTDAWSASKRRQKSSSAKGADGFAELENIHRKTVTGDVRTKRLQLKRPAKYSQDVWRGVTNDDSSILDETVAPLPSPPAVDTLFSRIMDEDPFDQPTHMATTSHMSPSCEDEPVHNALATENPPAQTDSDSFSDTNLPPNLGPERTNIVQNPRAFHLPFSPSATNAGHAAPETDDARAVMVCAEKPAKRQRVDASENKLNLSIVRQLPASGTSQIETPPAQKSANNGPFRPRFLRKIGAPSWVGSQDATDDVQGSTAMPPAARASTQFGEETPSNSRNNQVDGQTIAGSDARREKLRSTKLFLMSSEDSHRSSYAASVHDGHLHKQRSSSRTQPTSPISAAVGIASAADFNAKPSVDFGKSDQESSNAVQRQPSADDAGESSDFEAWLNDHTVEED